MPPHLVCCVVLQLSISCAVGAADLVAMTVVIVHGPAVDLHGTQQQVVSESPP